MKNRKKNGSGSITVPRGRLVQSQEMVVATILSWTGDDVQFLSENGKVTPDIRYQGMLWEIKSLRGTSKHTVENNIRLALLQSSNIVIDLQLTKMMDEKCLGYIKQQVCLRRQIKHLIVITKKQQVVKLK